MLISDLDVDSILAEFSTECVNLLLVGEEASLDIVKLIAGANEKGFEISGGIFPMVIYENKHLKDGVILKKLETNSTPILIKDIGLGKTDFDLPKLPSDSGSCVILLDGLMKNISVFLERVYGKYWNTISYVGAGCGSLSLEQTPCLFTNEGVFQDAALLLVSSKTASLGVKHGWEKIKGPYIANQTDGNTILELNWKPAFETYKEIVEADSGLQFSKDNFFEISKAYPFGIAREGMEDLVRDPITLDKEGGLVCVGNVSKNVVLNILKGEKSNLIESAKVAAEKALACPSPSDIFIVDCISRVLYLEADFDKELKEVKRAMDDREIEFALEGVLSLGEISSNNDGYLELYNKTIVVSAFY